jgi:hypothetical protein
VAVAGFTPRGSRDLDYDGNIQIAELNSLNAALAVIKWKKLCGFYNDRKAEHFSAEGDGRVSV